MTSHTDVFLETLPIIIKLKSIKRNKNFIGPRPRVCFKSLNVLQLILSCLTYVACHSA